MYSLRPILLFVNTDVSTIKIYLDTSTLAKSIIGRREYIYTCLLDSNLHVATSVYIYMCCQVSHLPIYIRIKFLIQKT
jgi:hypothetical protein